ncbi:MAG: ABC transporter ATP-binding protein [Eggerthellaceae bacterium]|nr:ABC transporter ATP-binding protein [Eggerthellaceae bacterium]
MPSISFKGVDYAYVDATETYLALEDVNLEIRDGEFLCLVGHSGCGKSTMLNLIAGLERPTRGEILIDSTLVEGPGPDRSIVFQNYSLFPWQTALKNVVFALRQTNKQVGKAEAEARAHELLEQVGVADAANRYPSQLSGGMRQRVAIARALAIDAPIMLLDEPFGALDPMIRRRLQDMLLQLWEGSCCKTAVFVTHDIDEALILADRIVFMEPKHIVKTFELPANRDRTAAEDDPAMRAIKDEVLELFEATEMGRED